MMPDFVDSLATFSRNSSIWTVRVEWAVAIARENKSNNTMTQFKVIVTSRSNHNWPAFHYTV